LGYCSLFAIEQKTPNVLLIMVDDFGWGDASCNNSKPVFKTPAIDQLAREGIRFNNAFTPHSVCTPTRYALLTGRYCWRTHVREGVLAGYGQSLIPKGRVTLGSLFKSKGYRTAVVGKWHVGLDWVPVEGDPGDWHWGTQVRAKGTLSQISQRVDHSKPIALGPLDLGFDYCFISPSNNSRIPVFVRDRRVVGSPERDETGLVRDPMVQRDSVDDIFVEKAISFIEDSQKRDNEQPFFLYLPLNAPHSATKAPKRFIGKSGVGLREDRCLWANESVGKILAALKRMQLEENTLVIFTSDNGPTSPRKWIHKTQSYVQLNSAHRAAGPYRGYKTDAWDGGVRVPLIARWPAVIKAGGTSESLFSLSDFVATFASLLDAPLPTWAGEDSFDQLACLLGRSQDSGRDHLITQSYTGVMSIRHGDWKLIVNTTGSGGSQKATPGFQPIVSGNPWTFSNLEVGQLYNLTKDPYEQNDLFASHPERVSQLSQKLQNYIDTGRTRAIPQ
jgi:arylsulfatase A-like enzyme